MKEFERARPGTSLEKMERTKFFCPTSILKIEVDNTTPIGYGMPEKAAGGVLESPALETWIPSRPIGTGGSWPAYPESNVLLSGWLLGEDVIARKAAVVDTQLQKGSHHPDRHRLPEPGADARDLQVPAQRPPLSAALRRGAERLLIL